MRRVVVALMGLGLVLSGCEAMLDWKSAEYVGAQPDAGWDASAMPRDAAAPGLDAAAPGLDASVAPDAGPEADLFAVWGSDRTHVWAVGARGTILRWSGADFQAETVPAGVTEDLQGIWGTSGSDVFAVGTGGRIVHFDGTAWSIQVTPAADGLNAVWGYSSSDVLAVGEQGRVLHGKIVGGTFGWGMVCPDPSNPVTHPCTTASDTLLAVSAYQRYDTAPDGGTDLVRFSWGVGSGVFRGPWAWYGRPAAKVLRAVAVKDENNAWAAGREGTLLKLEAAPDGGVLDPTPLASGTSADLYGMWAGAAELRLVGKGGTLLCCTIGPAPSCGACANAKLPAGFTADLRGVWGTGVGDEFWVVGTGGARAHWTE